MTQSRTRNCLIGRLAESTGVNIETIRFYERIGLVPAPQRTGGGHRVYSDAHLQRLSFVRRSRELGFSLDDIRMLLAISGRGNGACADTKALTLRHLTDVRGKIASLRKLERALKGLAGACRPGGQFSCPILAALSKPTSRHGVLDLTTRKRA